MKGRWLLPRTPRRLFSLGMIVVIGVGGGSRLARRAEPPLPGVGHHALKATNADTPSVESGAKTVETALWSAALGREMPLTVFLPPGYESSATMRYPVLYMLHGLGSNHLAWQQDGLFAVATEMMRSGDLPRMIIVTPEGEDGYWMDHAGGGPQYGTYMARDVVSYIDRHYRTVASGAFRAIGGMSMGAHGALQLALNNPGEFDTVGAHSLVLRNKAQAFEFFGDQSYFESFDPVSIVRKDSTAAAHLNLWIDIGSGDSWSAAAASFDQQLRAEHIAHLWHLYSGGHDDTYWTSHLRDYLNFYGHSFEASAASASEAPEAGEPGG